MVLADILFLVLLVCVFVSWAIAMFQALWRINKRAMAKSAQDGGGPFSGTGHALRAYVEFLTSDKDHRERRRLLFLTFLLFAVIASFAMLAPRLT